VGFGSAGCLLLLLLLLRGLKKEDTHVHTTAHKHGRNEMDGMGIIDEEEEDQMADAINFPSPKKKKRKTVFLILPKIGVRKEGNGQESRNPMDIKVDIRKESRRRRRKKKEVEKVERTFVFDDDNQWNQFEVHS
jgi:hypothetical protein